MAFLRDINCLPWSDPEYAEGRGAFGRVPHAESRRSVKKSIFKSDPIYYCSIAEVGLIRLSD